MTDWTKETISQSPHWRKRDITDRNISRKDMEDRDTTTRNDITKHIFPNNYTHTDVRRVDIENIYGSKNTTDFTKETKSTVSYTEETKSNVSHTEEIKSTVSWTEETK